MAQLSEKLLSWLYTNLHEYYDARRTYSDVVKVLTAYQTTIKARTDRYTYENGTLALLLNLYGTIPVAFRGTTYLFPIRIWIPYNYPHEPPIIYVVPEKDIVVRPGQHVGVDGRVYHPYLRDWGRMWEHAGVLEFLSILQQVFAKEPPVVSKSQQQQQLQRPVTQGPQTASPPGQLPPQLPPKQRFGPEPVEMPSVSTPPPRPPKLGESSAPQSTSATRDGPPLPPLPHEINHNQRFSSPGQSRAPTSQGHFHTYPSPPPNSRDSRAPSIHAVPPLSQQHLLRPQHVAHPTQDRSPVSPMSPSNGYSELPENRYSRAPPLPTQQPQWPAGNALTTQSGSQPHQYPPPFSQTPAIPHAAPNVTSHSTNPQPAPQPQRKPVVDLLSDPFDIALPSLTATGPPPPAPPIPPNPEKEHLLQALSSTLVQQARQKVSQNLSAIAPLQAQQMALRSAHERLEAEIRQLEQLDQVLSNNEAILHRSIQDCDRTIATAKSKKQPAIDDVLLAPTMVANQLWTLCAEEEACREAMYVLQKALDRGRISGNDFVRQMRGLGRERFRKMALARKCAKGMGLEVPR